MARPFDKRRLEAVGEPMPLGEVRQARDGTAAFSVSQTGRLAYQARVASETQLVWVTRDGKVVGSFPPRRRFTPSRLPQTMSAHSREHGDLWLLDATRGTASRFTTDPLTEGHPVWSPTVVASRSPAENWGPNRADDQSRERHVGSGTVLPTPTLKWPTDWSADGRTLVFEERKTETGWNVGVVSSSRRPCRTNGRSEPISGADGHAVAGRPISRVSRRMKRAARRFTSSPSRT